MFKVSLATYSIRVYDKMQQPQRVDAFGTGCDLIDVLAAFLEGIKSKSAHDPQGKVVLSTIEIKQEGRTISGLIESGIYGRGSRLRHIDDFRVTHERSAKEADMLPFYFLIDVPEMSDEAFLILERAGNIGIRKVVGAAISECFEKTQPDFVLRLWHVGRGDVVRAYLDGGEVSAVRFIHFGLSGDFADMLPTGHKEGAGIMELTARPSRGKSFLLKGRIEKYVKGDVDLSRFIELQDFPYDTVKLDVSKDGSTRTIDLNRLKMRGFYDISDKVQRDAQGNPTFDSIDVEARKLMAEMKAGVYAPPE